MVNGAIVRSIRFWVVVGALLTFFGDRSAWAKDPAPSPTVVILVEGGDDKVRTDIASALPAPWVPADGDAMASAARNRKLPATANAIRDRKTRPAYLQKIAQIAVDVGAKAAIVIQLPKGKKRVGHVILISSTGPTLLDTQLTLGAPEDDGAVVVRAFSRELVALTPAAEPAPTTAPASAVTDAPSEASPTVATAPAPDAPPAARPALVADPAPWIVATATMELANRHLSYQDVVTSNIHSDDSGIVPTPSIAVDLFPFAPSGTPYLRDLGVFGDVKVGLGPHKTLTDGTKVPITWTRFDAGLKYRIFVKRASKAAPIFAGSVSYGQESYVFHPPNPPAAPLDTPSAAYQILRPRVEARVPAGPVAVLVGGGYLAVLNTAAFAGNFRSPSIYGWEADLALAVPIGNVLELRGGIAYRRFVHIFGPERGDDTIASVAVDQMLRGELGVSAHF